MKNYCTFQLNELIEFTQTLSVLYVEDNKEAREAITALLKNFFSDIVVAKDGIEGYEKYKEQEFDLIISDIRMPRMSGIEMIRLIREENDEIAIIVTTAHQETEYLMECIELCVNGYLLKPLNLKSLTKVIQQNCEKIYYKKEMQAHEESLEKLVIERTKELENTQEILKNLVNIDPLTGLYNRRYFNEISKTLYNISKRNKETLSALMIDIDRFKLINDTYGHMVGDRVLIRLAKEIMYSLRSSDVGVRFGGEEFIVLLPSTDLEGASQIAKKVKENIQKSAIIVDDSQENIVKVTVSIGVASCECPRDNDIDALVHRADEALYEAKRAGRDTIRCYNISRCGL